MELKAILLFTEFPYVNVLYRAFDGEYFVELDDVQAYLVGVGGGAYTVINRTTPLPPLPEPLPEDSPIWVLINNPVTSNGLRYDGVISYTSTTVGSLGAVTFVVNKVGAFRVGNYIFAVSRKGASAGMLKYGQITAINSNNLTINFLEFEGTGSLANDEWDVILTGRRGLQGIQGISGVTGLIHNSLSDPTIDTVASVGDLFLNITTGTLYEKSAMTQSQFFASGLQGIALPNSIWITRGNLKGATGENGINGTRIKVGTDHLSFSDANTGDLYLNTSTWHVWKFTSAVDANSEFPIWDDLESIKGVSGKDAVEILTGTGIVYLSNAQLGKHLIVPANSTITQISFRDTTISTITTFLCLKGLQGGVSYYPSIMDGSLPAQVAQVRTNDFFAIENYTTPQDGYWFTKTNLNSGTTIKVGTDHLSFPNPKTGDLYINISTGHIWEFISAEDAGAEFGLWNDLGAIN